MIPMSENHTDEEIDEIVSGTTIESVSIERNSFGILNRVEIELETGHLLGYDDGDVFLLESENR